MASIGMLHALGIRDIMEMRNNAVCVICNKHRDLNPNTHMCYSCWLKDFDEETETWVRLTRDGGDYRLVEPLGGSQDD